MGGGVFLKQSSLYVEDILVRLCLPNHPATQVHIRFYQWDVLYLIILWTSIGVQPPSKISMHIKQYQFLECGHMLQSFRKTHQSHAVPKIELFSARQCSLFHLCPFHQITRNNFEILQFWETASSEELSFHTLSFVSMEH